MNEKWTEMKWNWSESKFESMNEVLRSLIGFYLGIECASKGSMAVQVVTFRYKYDDGLSFVWGNIAKDDI